MNNEKVSIILPAYNVESYLCKCLDSIVGQTYQNIEIIIVDDGSKDDTYRLALMYAEKDSRINVVHQKNAGSGPARNKGLELAKGAYVMFVDPDDWIDTDMVEDFMHIVKQYDPDIITSGYIEEYDNGKTVHTREVSLLDEHFENQRDVREHYVDLFLKEAVCAPTRILYKRSIITENGISFPDLRRSQDIVFNYNYYDKVESLVASSKTHYHYRIESGTYLQKQKQDYYKTIELMYRDIKAYLKKWEITVPKDTMIRFENRFFVLIAYYIESCITQKHSYKQIFENESMTEIASSSAPIDLYHKLLKNGILHRNTILIAAVVNTKVYVKKHMKLVFECFRKVKKY